MKKLLFIGCLFLGLNSFADEFVVKDLSAGMFSFPTANAIPDNAASSIQNFYTDTYYMAEERKGYEKMSTTAIGNSNPVSGLWKFYDSSANEWIVSFSSRTFWKNKYGEAPTQILGPTQTVDTVPDCATNLGKLWCTNGTDSVWWFDGTSTASVTTAPKGRILEAWRTRIVIADVASNRSTIYFSEEGDGTSWTVGDLEIDPFYKQIGGANDGYPIIGVVGSYLDNLVAFRRKDIWFFQGFDQTDMNVRAASNEIGCIDGRTIQELDGSLIFLSNRGMEKMTGWTIESISEPIRNLTDELIKNTVNERSNTQTSAADWGSGTFDSSVFVDTKTYDGNIQLKFPDYFNEFRDGTLGTENIWAEYTYSTESGSIDISNNRLNLNNNGGTLGRKSIKTSNYLPNLSHGTTAHFLLYSMPTDSGHLSDLYFTLYKTGPSILMQLDIESTTTGKAYLAALSLTGASGPLYTTSDYSIPMEVDIFIATTTYQILFNGLTVSSGSHSATQAQVYVDFGYLKGTAGAGICSIDNFGVSPQTATFTSQVINSGVSISTWGVFNKTDSGSTLSYQFNSSTNSSISLFNSSSWTTLTNGAVPTNSTNPYYAVRVSMSASTWTAQPILQDFTARWNEGSSPLKTSGTYDRRYWLCMTTNPATAAYNNTTMVYQRNKSWTLLNGLNVGSMAIFRDKLYFGSSQQNGYIYRFDIGNSDDGSSIVSEILTKSYDMGIPHKEKEFSRLYLNFTGRSSYLGSFYMYYDIDRSENFYSLGSVNLNEGTGNLLTKFHFPASNVIQGRELQYILTKSGTGDRLKLDGFITDLTTKEPK